MAKNWAKLGKIRVGDGHPVALIGIINLSQDSFYRGSVVRSSAAAVRRAVEMVEEGASIIDVGAMGTGPRSKPISSKEEFSTLVPAVKAIAREIDAPISVDTQRAEVARAAVEAGATIVNDISGLKSDGRMAEVIAETGSSALLMAAKNSPGDVYEIAEIKRALVESLKICEGNGVQLDRVVVDPAIGSWPGRLKRLGGKAVNPAPGKKYSYAAYLDLKIIANLSEFRKLSRPICVGISRKSFVGSVLGFRDPTKRLLGSLAASAIAVINGADVLRTHDPAETLEAVRIAEEIKAAR